MNKPYLIADVGINTNGDFKRACESIFQAKQCGFDAVKFQVYDPYQLTSNKDTQKLLVDGRFDIEWLPEIRSLCDDLEIDLAITPFYPEAVDVISPYIDWIKIGSYEVDYTDLTTAIYGSDKPYIISTGMMGGVSPLFIADSIMAFMYCVSKYPCGADDVDMNILVNFTKTFTFPIGYSDHSRNPNVIFAALAAGAEYIEMHFDIDGNGLEYDMGHVWTAQECYAMIRNIKEFVECFQPTDFRPDYSKRTNQEGRRQ